jgi:transcriptional regulator GlxA family with amidase domain
VPYKLDRVIATAAQRLIERDLANIPPLPALAARVGTHEKRLTRAFRAHTGRTVLEFVREERLLRAQHLLAQPRLSIEDVAHAIGFSGAANFTTAFKERFGSTPAAYRQLSRDCACGA